MLGFVKNIFGRSKPRRPLRAFRVPLHVRARYDAAQTTEENRRHWAAADLLSADAANNPRVRAVLRSRARYEVANNSYARGIVATVANVAAGNSSGYNYASGRLDHQTYYKSIRVDQDHLGMAVLDRVLRAWLDEAILISELLPLWMRTAAFRDLPHQWFWDGQEHVDPAKEASAQSTRLQNHTTTLAYEYARQGRDWESELRQRAKEVALMQELGLPVAQSQTAAIPVSTDSGSEE